MSNTPNARENAKPGKVVKTFTSEKEATDFWNAPFSEGVNLTKNEIEYNKDGTFTVTKEYAERERTPHQ